MAGERTRGTAEINSHSCIWRGCTVSAQQPLQPLRNSMLGLEGNFIFAKTPKWMGEGVWGTGYHTVRTCLPTPSLEGGRGQLHPGLKCAELSDWQTRSHEWCQKTELLQAGLLAKMCFCSKWANGLSSFPSKTTVPLNIKKKKKKKRLDIGACCSSCGEQPGSSLGVNRLPCDPEIPPLGAGPGRKALDWAGICSPTSSQQLYSW